MGRRRKKVEEHGNHEGWAIPYGDLITLLLAFFVVMYSVSSVNEGEYRVLSETLLAAFRGEPRTPQPIRIGDERAGTIREDVELDPIPRSLVDQPPLERLEESGDGDGEAVALEEDPGEETRRIALEDRARDIEAGLRIMAEEVRQSLGELIELENIRVRESPFWLELEVETDILFPSGSATVSAAARPVLEQIAEILQPFPNPVRVEGHTDNVPISTALFPSNWELSAARAANVVRLFQDAGIDAERLAAIGMGEYRPTADNATAEGRNLNRRVLIVVLAADAPEGPDSLYGRYDETGENG
ncbi:flagellar motor protein MotD [Wenzhouxiangella limi]|uniref:Flagellar motor protein MotD n=1 Tax=Wenzhouxiangella limi TaxID=2707351 RepID=A0A845UZI4_9GAMM|nr:flagellar motor protein MotD [Wenzhouxiangella limi]NDY95330.1 flagellar motor protein MotD [Wenzhouxiangella limi]